MLACSGGQTASTNTLLKIGVYYAVISVDLVQRHAFLAYTLVVLTTGCQLLSQKLTGAGANGSEPAASAEAKPEGSAKGSKENHAHGEPAASSRAFGLPFVREPGTEDPVERARGFLREVLGSNSTFVQQHEASFFKPFLDGQKPRATVVTCSDSRVQSPAFDATPDNDVFTIRNIGNQIATSEGSVEYGVEHLHTPVLLILGHSGCGAVKAALGDFSHEPEAIQRELTTLDLTPVAGSKSEKPEKGARTNETTANLDGVFNNVHHQVATALAKFSDQVTKHELIVLGAVYDFRNDLRKKHGMIHIINVNGHREEPKLTAFLRAVRDMPSSGEAQDNTSPLASTGANPRSAAGTSTAAPAGRERSSTGREAAFAVRGESGPAARGEPNSGHETTFAARGEPNPAPRGEPGSSRRESGAAERESGAPRRESGAAERESGAPRRESGAAERESGAPRRESGGTEREPTPAERAALAKAWREATELTSPEGPGAPPPPASAESRRSQ